MPIKTEIDTVHCLLFSMGNGTFNPECLAEEVESLSITWSCEEVAVCCYGPATSWQAPGTAETMGMSIV